MVRSQADGGTQFITTTFRPELVKVAGCIQGVQHSHKVSNVREVTLDEALNFVGDEHILEEGKSGKRRAEDDDDDEVEDDDEEEEEEEGGGVRVSDAAKRTQGSNGTRERRRTHDANNANVRTDERKNARPSSAHPRRVTTVNPMIHASISYFDD